MTEPPDMTEQPGELAQLDQRIAGLAARQHQLQVEYAAVVADLAAAQHRRAVLAAELPGPAGPAAPPAPASGIQTLLFAVGGLLLGAGAIVFAVVAWHMFGTLGQAVILATGTLLALSVPPLARARDLRGVAETVAVLGLLLVLLDGYAAWRAGLTGDLAGTTWAGLVCGGTAVLAGLYGRWTRLASPALTGLAVAQPALLLLAAEWLRGAAYPLTGIAYLLVVTAAGNLAVRWWLSPGLARQVMAWVMTGGALAFAVPVALVALFIPTEPGPAAVAGGALVAGAVVLAGALRLTGLTAWPVVAAPGLALAVALAGGRAVELATGLPLPTVAYLLLAGAGVLLAGSLAAGSVAAGRAIRPAGEAAASTGAVVALLFALIPAGSTGPAAGIAALWGAALAVRAVLPGLATPARIGWGVAATGCQVLAWWLLLGSWQVEQVEAYTLPAAAVAVAAGWWARRSRPQLGSWLGYGPGLAVAALPSLAVVLVDPVPLRRLLLGAAAVAVLLAGARWRLRAPAVIGGVVAGLLALYELALISRHLPTWIPLTVAGLLLVGLAATYERRRRDLTRLRAAVGRMS